MKYIGNIFWILWERAISNLGSLLVAIFVARYLGPQDMGILNYSIALVALIVPLSQLGSEQIIFNRVALNPEKGTRLMLVTRGLRFLSFLFLSLILIAFLLYKQKPFELIVITCVVLLSRYYLIQDVYRLFFNATHKARKNAMSAQVSLVLSLLLRLALVFIKAPLIFFSFPYFLNSFLSYKIRKSQFSKEPQALACKKIDFNSSIKYWKYSLKVGIPLALSGFSVIVYTRISQVIIGDYYSFHEVGIYNAAVTISQAWAFIPMAVITTLFAKILKRKGVAFESGISAIFLSVVIVSIPFLIILYIFSEYIMLFSYGSDFKEAAQYIFILSMSSFIALLSFFSSRIIVFLGGYKYIFFKTFIVCVINLLLNYYLIPVYGLMGACISTLLTELISLFFGSILFKNGKVLLLFLRSFLAFTSIKEIFSDESK